MRVQRSAREVVSVAVKRTGGRRGRDTNFQLKYLHDTNTAEEDFEDVTRFCPDLRTIFLDNPDPGVLCMLDKFQHLRQTGPLSLVEECRGSSLIDRELP